MGEFNSVFCVLTLMFVVSGVLSLAQTQCTLKSFLHCSDVINSLENDMALTDGMTCQALDGAISCVQGVMDSCSYPCGIQHEDLSTNNGGKCPMYTQLYISPVFGNLQQDEHPCVVLQVLKHCRDTKCVYPPTDTFGSNLHALAFDEATIKSIQKKRMCTQNPITKYIKRFEDETIQGLTYDTCQEMKLSWELFEKNLNGTFRCLSSRIQEMSVDMAGNGMKRLIRACQNVKAPVHTAAQGESLPFRSKECSSTAIQECWNQEFNDYCPYYRKIANCIDSIEKNCKDDQVKKKLDYHLAGSKARAEQCPGMKSGDCFAGALINCHGGIPFGMKNFKDVSEDEKNSMCKVFIGKGQSSIDCMNELKTKCTSKHAQSEVDVSLNDIKEIQKSCANYN